MRRQSRGGATPNSRAHPSPVFEGRGSDSEAPIPSQKVKAERRRLRVTSSFITLESEAPHDTIDRNGNHPLPCPARVSSGDLPPTPKASRRVLEFFTAQINNDHTRKAYMNATRRFAAWCELHSIAQLADVQAVHVAAFVKELQTEFTAPTVKQHLAALRMLFDWLMTGHVLDVNPAQAVRGPKYVVRKGKTPALTAEEARELLDSIETVRSTAGEDGETEEQPDLIGLRDRAMIGVMVYTFARISAVLQMKVGDFFVQGRRSWVRLHKKVARSMKFLVTTVWSSTSMNTSPTPASRENRTRLYSRRRPARPAR